MDFWNWNDKYTTDEMNILIDNMWEIVCDNKLEQYNSGLITKAELINELVDIGFHRDYIVDMFDWIEEE